MFDLKEIRIKRVFPGSEGRFVQATYADWKYEYNFYIDPQGRIKGQTSTENWVDVSVETAAIIRDKLKTAILETEGGSEAEGV